MTDLFAAADLEKMLRETGGVSVSVQGVDTWGHEEVVSSVGAAFESRPGGVDDVVVVATDILSSPIESGLAITVDGGSVKVLDHERIEDGLLTAMLVGSWTHTVDIYRPSPEGESTRGQQQQSFGSPIETGASCDLMARSGEIRAMESGDVAAAEWEGRFPPGTDLQPGDRLKVTAGTGPERWRVTFVGDRTSRWKIPVEMTESDEDFG